jgi:hypothetical protein
MNFNEYRIFLWKIAPAGNGLTGLIVVPKITGTGNNRKKSRGFSDLRKGINV